MGIVMQKSHDEDSRKLFLAVMLNQGSAERRHRRNGHCMQKSRDKDSRKPNPDSRAIRGRQNDPGTRGNLCKMDGHIWKTDSQACMV